MNTERSGETRESESRERLHIREDEPVPYRWPRGAVVGSRIGLRVAEAVCVLLILGLIALVAYMSKTHLGR
jgi:hypothetical protein